mgnify:FL=1
MASKHHVLSAEEGTSVTPYPFDGTLGLYEPSSVVQSVLSASNGSDIRALIGVSDAVDEALPSGTIAMFDSGSAAPDGWADFAVAGALGAALSASTLKLIQRQ